jgi:hypothetical protein
VFVWTESVWWCLLSCLLSSLAFSRSRAREGRVQVQSAGHRAQCATGLILCQLTEYLQAAVRAIAVWLRPFSSAPCAVHPSGGSPLPVRQRNVVWLFRLSVTCEVASQHSIQPRTGPTAQHSIQHLDTWLCVR